MAAGLAGLVAYVHQGGDGLVTGDVAYAPFGEKYVLSGIFGAFFTGGALDDLAPDIRDFPAREYETTSGRWLSPDPAGVAAVDITNPQSWNRYAYAGNNPLANVDPTGLDACSQYSASGANGQYTQCEAQQNMYKGSDLAYGWTDPFQLSQIPVTVISYVQGQAPQPISLGFPSSATSLKSSVFRGILNTSNMLGKGADTLPLVNLDYALMDGLIAEINAMNRGQCQ